MPTLTAEQIITLLAQYVTDTGDSINVLIVGALALHAYGVSHRTTRGLDAELQGPLTSLMDYLAARNIPADLTQNFSGWSVVAMPPGYRDRAVDLINRPRLRVRVLSPLDFVIAKLRRGTELDLDDAYWWPSIISLPLRPSGLAHEPLSPPRHRTPLSSCFRKRWTSFARASRLRTALLPTKTFLRELPEKRISGGSNDGVERERHSSADRGGVRRVKAGSIEDAQFRRPADL